MQCEAGLAALQGAVPVWTCPQANFKFKLKLWMYR